MPQGPREHAFVLDVPVIGTSVDRHADFDIYRPIQANWPLPAVVFVPGPVPAKLPSRPRDWQLYQGYGRLAARRGMAGVVVAQHYHALSDWPVAAEKLASIIEAVRALDEIRANEIVIWAFSGGAMLVGHWLADSSNWLRALALTYPLLRTPDGPRPSDPPEPADMLQPGRPVVLTRVGHERPDWQATVDDFLSRAADTGTAVTVIDVPDGQHGFDALDHTAQSRHAVIEAMKTIERYLAN